MGVARAIPMPPLVGCATPTLPPETTLTQTYLLPSTKASTAKEWVVAALALQVSLNFSVDEAYLIENGKITKPLKGATLIGEAKEIMNKISMCSQDLRLAAGFCGSNQWQYLCDGRTASHQGGFDYCRWSLKK